MRFLVGLFILTIHLFALNKDFDLYKMDGKEGGNTLLIVGGIHGDEPGGYFAPAILQRYYKIQKGNLWVIPNLNGDSIMANTRGIYNDMNRKFASIEKNDPDFFVVKRVKEIILNKDIDLILNLHDGYGFFREKYENAIFNPNSWGQATIIDQSKVNGSQKFSDLNEIASSVNSKLNGDKLFQNFHSFNVKNTETKFKDEQMKLSLTYFAVTNNKPAFAIETSKNITDLTQKVVYQLKSIEEFMRIMNIEFSRDFDLNNEEEVKKRIYDFGNVTINSNILFDLKDIRKTIKYVPLKNSNNDFKFDHPLGRVKYTNNKYELYIGNIQVAEISAQTFEMANCPTNNLKMEVDGKVIDVNFAQQIDVKESFKILKIAYRVNIIGFSRDNVESEDSILIKRSDISDNYALDNKGKRHRVEFYKDGKFCGMIVVNFSK